MGQAHSGVHTAIQPMTGSLQVDGHCNGHWVHTVPWISHLGGEGTG